MPVSDRTVEFYRELTAVGMMELVSSRMCDGWGRGEN
jgi:hypothetical protein